MALRYIILIVIFVWSFFFIDSIITTGTVTDVKPKFIIGNSSFDNTFYQFLPNYDTIYILSDVYIAIKLSEQKAILYKRNGDSLIFPISSGSAKISKGMETPEGIYTVQSRYKQAISKQFNNAKLFNWIGFNGNIGFHGLEGTSYERLLGLRPSSHGCVRISNRDGELLYNEIKIGTPVIVFKELPARIFVFAEKTLFKPNQDILLSSSKKDFVYMKNRLKNLYDGNIKFNLHSKVFLDGETPLKKGGFEVGSSAKLPLRQDLPQFLIKASTVISDRIKMLNYPIVIDSSVFAMD